MAHYIVADDPWSNDPAPLGQADLARVKAWWDQVASSVPPATVVPSRLGPVDDFEVTELPLPIIQKDISFRIPGLDGVRVQRLGDFTVRVLNSWDELAKALCSETPVVYEEPQPDVVIERKGE